MDDSPPPYSSEPDQASSGGGGFSGSRITRGFSLGFVRTPPGILMVVNIVSELCARLFSVRSLG